MPETPPSGAADPAAITGLVVVELTGPEGEVKHHEEIRNRVTTTGSEMYAKRGSGIGSPPGPPTCMRLGSGVGAVAFTGAGSFIETYLANTAIPGTNNTWTTPTAPAAQGNGWRVIYITQWGTGQAVYSNINECVISNEVSPTSVAGTAANTISRVVFGSTINKATGDTLTVTWYHDLAGA